MEIMGNTVNRADVLPLRYPLPHLLQIKTTFYNLQPVIQLPLKEQYGFGLLIDQENSLCTVSLTVFTFKIFSYRLSKYKATFCHPGSVYLT